MHASMAHWCIDRKLGCLQVPEERMPELSTDEREHVELFMKATPSVVNIANIGVLLTQARRHLA